MRENLPYAYGPEKEGGGGFFLDEPRKRVPKNKSMRQRDRRTPYAGRPQELLPVGPGNYPPPATAIEAARSFYLKRGAHRFVIDVPFVDTTTPARHRRSLGNSMSLVLIAKSKSYAELKDEIGEPAEDARAIDQLKTDLLLTVEQAARFTSKPFTAEQQRYFESQFAPRIDDEFITRSVKEALSRASQEKKKEVADLKDAAKRITHGEPLGLMNPPMPDDFSRAQRALTAVVLENLRAEDGTSLPDFIQSVSDGTIKEVVPTGLWRNRIVDDAIDALDESKDVAAKRNEVESFLINLPITARNAIRSQTDLPPEQAERVLLAAEILYTRGQQLRTDRLKIDSPTVAAETARLNQNATKVYRTLFRMKILPPLRKTIELKPRTEAESDETYEDRMEASVRKHNREERLEAEKFRAERKPLMINHLLEFMNRLDSDSDMDGIFPGTLGTMLSSTGKDGRVLYRKILAEILARPDTDRFYKREQSLPSSEGYPGYVVVDPRERLLKQPPERMRKDIDQVSDTIGVAQKALDIGRQNVATLVFEAKSAWQTDLDLLAKRLDVLEADMLFPAAWTSLQGAYMILKNRGEPGSLTWRSTMDLQSKADKLTFAIKDGKMSLDTARRELVKKYITLAREQIKSTDGAADQYPLLIKSLDELEVVARNPKSSRENLVEALTFFANAD